MKNKINDTLLFKSRLNYLDGLPTIGKTIAKLEFEITKSAVYIYHRRKKIFPSINLPFDKIESISFKKGLGTFWYNSPIGAIFNESLIQFKYREPDGTIRIVMFELLASKIFPTVTYQKCQILKEILLSVPELRNKIAGESNTGDGSVC